MGEFLAKNRSDQTIPVEAFEFYNRLHKECFLDIHRAFDKFL